MRRALQWSWLGALLLGGWCAQAFAHPTQLSQVTFTLGGDVLHAEVKMNAFDLGEAMSLPALADAAGRADITVAVRHQARLARYLKRTLSLATAGGARCTQTLQTVDAHAQFLFAKVDWRCPTTRDGLIYESTLFHAIDTSARQIAVMNDGDATRRTLLDARNPQWVLHQPPTPAAIVARYAYAGVEHIFIGYDHIAFLLGVLLWGRRAWPLIKAVTAFTLAHSVTLALAVFDLVRIPATLVESAIALSIVYVAVQNYFVRELDTRWRVTGLLGLVHGLGFASVLREYGLPPHALGWALGAFNVGVEVGQLAIVLGAVGLLLTLDRLLAGAHAVPVRSPALVSAGSLVVGVLGLYWFVERVGWTAQ